ncbi:MAG: NAD-dependent epimerase/dehydratase family protein [Candidatus Pacebacteria bacterium]|nr:NAD-dependent epimerase/dehydratase family protein [Candidatus Paceibacterota bacterium]
MNDAEHALDGTQCILVTGGAGFVGSHLCERLAKEGHTVISLDNYFTGSVDNHVAGVEYREGHTKDIATHVPETVDVIFHLGEYSRVAVAMEEPALVFDMNTHGTMAVLEFWRTQNCKLVYAGSSTKGAPDRDDGVAGRNLSPYSWSKAINTELVTNYARWYDLSYAISYFYNVYGPRELSGRYGTVVEIFYQCYKHGKKCTVNGPGTQTRNYTHVSDTVDALLRIGKEGLGDGYGIAAEAAYSPLQLAALYGLDVDLKPSRKTSRPYANLNIEKTVALGWKPKESLEVYIAAKKA